MIVHIDDELVPYLKRDGIIDAIRRRRHVIRAHRDAIGDDRCWTDDYLVWEMLNDTFRMPALQLSITERMARCISFYEHRRSETKDSLPEDAIMDAAYWDNDLWKKTTRELFAELIRIQEAIRGHRTIVRRPRTVDDDRKLYSVLPEKIPADFRLPPQEEFLGRERRQAGCPNFWDSHSNCGYECNVHQWGPCERVR